MTAISRRFMKTNANSRKFQQDRGIAVSEITYELLNRERLPSTP